MRSRDCDHVRTGVYILCVNQFKIDNDYMAEIQSKYYSWRLSFGVFVQIWMVCLLSYWLIRQEQMRGTGLLTHIESSLNRGQTGMWGFVVPSPTVLSLSVTFTFPFPLTIPNTTPLNKKTILLPYSAVSCPQIPSPNDFLWLHLACLVIHLSRTLSFHSLLSPLLSVWLCHSLLLSVVSLAL